MKNWLPACLVLGGLAATVVSFFEYGCLVAVPVALATVVYAGAGRDSWGEPRSVGVIAGLDPRAVRKYRLEHPGATVVQAATAVSETPDAEQS